MSETVVVYMVYKSQSESLFAVEHCLNKHKQYKKKWMA